MMIPLVPLAAGRPGFCEAPWQIHVTLLSLVVVPGIEAQGGAAPFVVLPLEVVDITVCTLPFESTIWSFTAFAVLEVQVVVTKAAFPTYLQVTVPSDVFPTGTVLLHELGAVAPDVPPVVTA